MLVDTGFYKLLYSNRLQTTEPENRPAHIKLSMHVVGIPMGIPKFCIFWQRWTAFTH
jgi:hypothetical protein